MGKVLFLGVEGSGKSCLTAALAGYFESHAENGWSLRPINKEAFAFSLRMPKKFAAGEMPAQTARFRHLQWSLCYADDPQGTLDVLDYPGEVYRLAFLDPSDDPNPQILKEKQSACAGEIRELMAYLKGADQIFVLFDISDTCDLDTNDKNVDAVWVTVQTMKILSSLESKPQLTLLVTQADRVEANGEDVSDVDALINRHVPIVGPYFSHISKLPISSVDADNARYGLLPLIRMLLERTELYKQESVKWDKIYERMGKGDIIIEEESKVCQQSARAFAWAIPKANFFLVKDGEFALYLEWERKMKEILAGVDSRRVKIKRLLALNVENVPQSVKALIGVYVRNEQSDRDADMGLGCFVIVMIGIISGIALVLASK